MQSGNVTVLSVSLTDDYNRVVLEPLDDTPDSDYINASYVDVSKLGSLWTTFTSSLHKVLQLIVW